jgi:hypothetical protein
LRRGWREKLHASRREHSGGGILIYAASGTASNDTISNLPILGNTLLNEPTTTQPTPTSGIDLEAGGSLGAVAPAFGNSLANVLVQANTIESSATPGNTTFGGSNPEYAIQNAGI